MGSKQEKLTGYVSAQVTEQGLDVEDTIRGVESIRSTESETNSLANIAESKLTLL